MPADTEWTVETTTTCEYCAGEGSYVVFGTTSNPHAIEPPEYLRECDTCNGRGTVYVERCERCGLGTDRGPWGNEAPYGWDRCDCDEDATELWGQHGTHPDPFDAAVQVSEYLISHGIDGQISPESGWEWKRREARIAQRHRYAAAILRDNDPLPPATKLLADLIEERAADFEPPKETDRAASLPL